MPAFRTLDDLRASLQRAGLGAHGDQLLAAARPTIQFLRVKEHDDGLPPGVNKIGGYPDLPEGLAWPMRPPFPDAAERAEAEKQSIRRVADSWSSAEFRDWSPKGAAAQEFLNALLAAAEERGRALAETFPLGFVGQFNLGTLAAEPGFDPALPRTGLLSVFEDVTAEPQPGVRICIWRPEPYRLVRSAPPERFVRHFDLCGPDGMRAGEKWATMSFAETLVPFSGVSVPYHWRSLIPYDSRDWEKVNDWWYAEEERLSRKPPRFEGHGPNPPHANFSDDRLGGWPDPMQDDPENHVDHRRIVAVGDAPFLHILTTGGDFPPGDRRMTSAGKGDGRSYYLIDPDDLAARRFEMVQCVAQSD